MDAVAVNDFTFAYPGQPAPVLHDVSLTVPEGAFAVLTGSTGSGKTTLLRCMTEALAPAGERSGSIRVFGSERPSAFEVGFVMQDPESQLVCDTVVRELAFGLENMGMPPDAMRRRVAEAATFLGIGQLASARTAELSGGQKQLVNLAAILAMRPRLLLLDEPTAQLDPMAVRQLCDALRLVNGQLGLTVVVATHAPELFADLATCAFTLEDGRVRQVGVNASVCAMGQRVRPFGTWPMTQTDEADGALDGCNVPVASVEDAWFSYAPDAPGVLKGLGLDVPAGSVTCILGNNGCGKTTLLKVMAGVLRPQRGTVRNAASACQAYLPQDPRLLLTDGPCAIGSDPLAHVTFCDRCLRMDHVPKGLTLWHTDTLLDLSGGQQQMLALAKLLAAKPRLLLLDEPVKGLDAEAELRLGLLLREATAEGTAVVVTTHDISFASRVADCIALMFDGQIASCATPAAFFEDAALFKPIPNAFTAAWDEAHAAQASLIGQASHAAQAAPSVARSERKPQ